MRLEWMAAVIVSVAGLARAQEQPAAVQPKETPAGQPADRPSAGVSLVEYDAAGKLKRPEVPAEQRAAEIMDLTPEERERVAKIVAEREQVLDEILLKNFNLLTRMHEATQAGNAAEARRISGMYLIKLERLTDRGRFEDEVRPQLRLDHQEEYTRLLVEYRRAILQEIIAAARAEGSDAEPQGLADREMRRGMAREIQRSYDRTIVDRVEGLAQHVAGLGLTPERESAVGAVLADFAREHADGGTSAQKRDLLMRVLKELEYEQRVALIKAIRSAQNQPG